MNIRNKMGGVASVSPRDKKLAIVAVLAKTAKQLVDCVCGLSPAG